MALFLLLFRFLSAPLAQTLGSTQLMDCGHVQFRCALMVTLELCQIRKHCVPTDTHEAKQFLSGYIYNCVLCKNMAHITVAESQALALGTRAVGRGCKRTNRWRLCVTPCEHDSSQRQFRFSEISEGQNFQKAVDSAGHSYNTPAQLAHIYWCMGHCNALRCK